MPDVPDNDLSDLEKRLSDWQPSSAGLSADAMLLAAGRASAPRPGRWLWPALAALGLLNLGLAGWLMVERSERLALAEQLQKLPSAAPAVAPPESLPAIEEPQPGSYLSVRRLLEQGREPWPEPPAPGAPGPPPTTLHVWQRDGLGDL
jgi:hypothetical protein